VTVDSFKEGHYDGRTRIAGPREPEKKRRQRPRSFVRVAADAHDSFVARIVERAALRSRRIWSRDGGRVSAVIGFPQ
jgi:hypothetical protein